MTRALASFLLLFLDTGTQRAPDRDDPPIHAGRRRGAGLRSAAQILPGNKPSVAGRGRSYSLGLCFQPPSGGSSSAPKQGGVGKHTESKQSSSGFVLGQCGHFCKGSQKIPYPVR
jgi:hypothetical protein